MALAHLPSPAIMCMCACMRVYLCVCVCVCVCVFNISNCKKKVEEIPPAFLSCSECLPTPRPALVQAHRVLCYAHPNREKRKLCPWHLPRARPCTRLQIHKR